MKIAITGGYGFIGSRLVDLLVNEGHEVSILDNMSTPVVSELKDVTTYQCDITSAESLKEVVLKDTDLLLHLAAQSSPFVAFENPQLDISINVLGTLNMIDWCRDNHVPRIVFASSFTAYGDQHECEALSEELIGTPKSVYGLSKHTCEQLFRIYAEPHGLKWNALRMFNVYGPGQDLSRRDQGMVSIFLGIIREEDHVGVKGSLKRFRDFVYIEDVLQGWMRCINNTDEASFNQIYNLGSGRKTRIDELLDELILATGKTDQVTYAEEGSTPGDLLGCYADTSKISRDLGYEAAWSFRDGIKQMTEWADLHG